MRVLVLGSGAGGGVPQWNCRCAVCAVAWDMPARVRHRTQTSLAVTADDRSFILLDASPDLRQQIIATPALHPRGGKRGSPLAAVFLTSGEVDHLVGLLCLREGHRFSLFGTRPTLDNLAASTMFDVLRPDVVPRLTLTPEQAVTVAGLRVTAFAVPGKVPLYHEGDGDPAGGSDEDVIGLEVSDGGRTVAYVPGVAHLPDALRDRLSRADILFLDGTTFTDRELIDAGVSGKTGARMGHLPMTGPGGSLDAFSAVPPGRKIYIHLNNTNPVLLEDSPERAAVTAAGWTVAHDGLEMVL